jgi:hypothetical protein
MKMKKKQLIEIAETLHGLTTHMTDLHKLISDQRQDILRLQNAILNPSSSSLAEAYASIRDKNGTQKD